MILIHPLTASNPTWLCLLEHRTGMVAVPMGNTAYLISKPKLIPFVRASLKQQLKGGAQ
ncbi:MAG TPA: hypothetical protein VIZ65_00320 [Cellvibrionaceae bacterium]